MRKVNESVIEKHLYDSIIIFFGPAVTESIWGGVKCLTLKCGSVLYSPVAVVNTTNTNTGIHSLIAVCKVILNCKTFLSFLLIEWPFFLLFYSEKSNCRRWKTKPTCDEWGKRMWLQGWTLFWNTVNRSCRIHLQRYSWNEPQLWFNSDY